MPIAERISALHQRGLLSGDDVQLLSSGNHQVQLNVADKMIENVVGVFGLPMGVALNFLINNRDYVDPWSSRNHPLSQVCLGLPHGATRRRLHRRTRRPHLDWSSANCHRLRPGAGQANTASASGRYCYASQQPAPENGRQRRQGANIEVFDYQAEEDGRLMVVMHLLVDTRDAMGANLVNTMCEGVASYVEGLTGGKVFLHFIEPHRPGHRARHRAHSR